MTSQADARPPWATIYIITRNSARWIDALLQFYDENGISPRVLLDSTTTDETEGILRQRRIDYRKVVATAPRVEAMVAEIAADQPSGWALRMDDDEAPSKALLDFLCGPPPQEPIAAVALARCYLRRASDGRLYRGRWTAPEHLADAMRNDWQWRLFRPERVVYTEEIHTPGFIRPEHTAYAPEQAAIAHLVWIVRSLDARRAKVADYDAQKPGAGSFFRTIYMPEDAPPGEVMFDPMPAGEFDLLARKISESAP